MAIYLTICWLAALGMYIDSGREFMDEEANKTKGYLKLLFMFIMMPIFLPIMIGILLSRSTDKFFD